MAKYRLLTFDELSELEKEFVEYLILNGITADDWRKIKAVEPDNAKNIMHLFSDVVFEKIMRETHYIERRFEKRIEIFQCLKDKFVVIGLDAAKVDEANFNESSYTEKALMNPPTKLEVFTFDKAYQKSRESEIFALTESGGCITDDKLFKTLCMFLPQ